MKKSKRTVAVLLIAALLVGGCSTFEPQHKTETVTETVTDGIFPYVIEKNVSYVQQTQDGEWEVENTEIVNWEITDVFEVCDTVWQMNFDDAVELYSGLDDSFKGASGTLYFHFGSDLNEAQITVATGDDGSSVLDVQLDMTADTIFIAQGNKICLYDVKVSGAEIALDGTTKLKVDIGEGEGILSVPSDAKEVELEDYLIKQSDTYITTIAFEDIPTFNVSSADLVNGVWDDSIANLSCGENKSPELTWDAVDGASQYVVVMIDGGWLHMDVYTTETSIAAGSVERGERGEQYVGPYPPPGSTHTYTVFVFALKNEPGKVSLLFDNSGNSVDLIYANLNVDADGNEGNVIAYARLDGNFTNK